MDETRTEGPRRAEMRRRNLIETARTLFIENGFHATGIAQIARESGIAVGQIYRDFASKEDIVAALVKVDCQEFLQAAELKSAIQVGDSEQVRAWLHDFLEPDDELEESRLFAEIVAESSRNDRIAAIFTAVQDEMRAHLLAALSLLAPGPALDERRAILADALMTMSLGLLHHRLMRPSLPTNALVQLFQRVMDDHLAALSLSGNRGLKGESRRRGMRAHAGAVRRAKVRSSEPV